MPARSIGTATISFGLVSIPVKLFTSSETGGEVHFNMLHGKCGSRLRQQYVCTLDGEVVERDQMTKGYEYARGQYVVLSPTELKALDAVASHTVALEEFVPVTAVDPLYIEKSYYLGPDKGGEKAYRLLGEAMLSTGLVGLASYAARGKSYICMVRPYNGGLLMHQLRYPDEVKAWDEVPMPDLPDVKPAELGLATQIIQQIANQTFEPTKYKDEVKGRVMALIQQKIDGQEIVMAPEAPQGKVIDLMEALRASLGAAGVHLPTKAADLATPDADDVDELAAAPKSKRRRAP